MKRLLMVVHRLPYPPDKGERVRAFHELKALSPHFRITLAALSHGATDQAAREAFGQWCETILTVPAGGLLGLVRGGLSLLAGGSVTEGYFRSRRLSRLVATEARRSPFDLVFAYSSGVLPLALAAAAPVTVMDLVDVDSAKWASYAERARWPMGWVYAREARGVQALERRAVERCQAVLLVSEAETRALGLASDKLIAVGNGVDTEYFRAVEGAEAGAPPSLVFTGTMDYRPNIEGVCWFVGQVWPAVRRELDGATFTIVGRDPAPAVRRLAETPGVVVTGSVSDVRPYLGRATVAIAPLWIARGVQNKVLEAMAMARAVIGTPAALEGLDVTPGENVLRAESVDEWRRTIVDLCRDAPRRASLGRAARQCVLDRYSWDARMKPLVDLCLTATAKGKGRRNGEL